MNTTPAPHGKKRTLFCLLWAWQSKPFKWNAVSAPVGTTQSKTTAKGTTMKIKITVTVNVDAEAWIAEYGIDKTELRDDVRASITASVTDSYAGSFFKEVAVK